MQGVFLTMEKHLLTESKLKESSIYNYEEEILIVR